MARGNTSIVVGLCVAGLATGANAAVTISASPTQNMSCSGGVCAPTAASANLNTGDLEDYLASGNLRVTTTGSGGTQASDIVVASSFTWTSTNSLTLDAYRSLAFQAQVTDNGSGAVSLLTDDGGSGGSLSFIAGGALSFSGTTETLTVNGQTYTLVNSVSSLAAAIKAKPSGRYALSASYNAGLDGTYSASPIPTKFKGSFNGLGNRISNLIITATGKLTGFFAYVDIVGQVSSLELADVDIHARDKKQGVFDVGPLAAANYGTVFNCFASGQVETKSPRIAVAGGLIGGNSGNISGSGASTALHVTGNRRSHGSSYAGDLVGYSDGTIMQSFAAGSVSSTNEGGVVAGSLVGYNAGSVNNSFALGSVSISGQAYAGGLVGFTISPTTSSYSTGVPSGGSQSDIGGLVGYDGGQNDFSNTYWDTTTSGITNLSQGAGNVANDPGITGLTTAQLQSGLPAGFDPTIWAQDPSINNGFPYLIDNPPQ